MASQRHRGKPCCRRQSCQEGRIKESDIITRVNGTTVTQTGEFAHIVQKSSAGSKLNLTVYRQGTTLDLTVTVIEKEQSALGEQNTSGSSAQQSTQKLPWEFGY